jgi:hypothetical protein
MLYGTWILPSNYRQLHRIPLRQRLLDLVKIKSGILDLWTSETFSHTPIWKLLGLDQTLSNGNFFYHSKWWLLPKFKCLFLFLLLIVYEEQRHFERRNAWLKSQADTAFKQKEYKLASKCYGLVILLTDYLRCLKGNQLEIYDWFLM